MRGRLGMSLASNDPGFRYTPAGNVVGIAGQDDGVALQGDHRYMPIHDIPGADCCRQEADAASRIRIERNLGDEITAEKAAESCLPCSAPPYLSNNGGTGKQRHMRPIRQQNVAPHRRRASVECDEGAGVEHDVLHAALRPPSRARRLLSALATALRESPSARAIDATFSADVGSLSSIFSRSATRSVRARAFVRIASATHALTEAARPALTSASARRARPSSRLTVIRRIS